jgi:hypothetical protein
MSDALPRESCLTRRYNEASFTCAARPALTLVIAVKGNGFGECGHMLLFTMIPLEGQPLASKPAGPSPRAMYGRKGKAFCREGGLF